MKIHLFFNRMQQPENFPVSVLKLQDILDRRQTPQDESTVVFSFVDSLPSKLKIKTFSADIYRLNLVSLLVAEDIKRMSTAYLKDAPHRNEVITA